MFKQVLLGGTALMGAAAMAVPSYAGTVGSKDAMSVTLGGTLRFYAGMRIRMSPPAAAVGTASTSMSPR